MLITAIKHTQAPELLLLSWPEPEANLTWLAPLVWMCRQTTQKFNLLGPFRKHNNNSTRSHEPTGQVQQADLHDDRTSEQVSIEATHDSEIYDDDATDFDNNNRSQHIAVGEWMIRRPRVGERARLVRSGQQRGLEGGLRVIVNEPSVFFLGSMQRGMNLSLWVPNVCLLGVNVLYFAEMLSFVPTAWAKIAITDMCENWGVKAKRDLMGVGICRLLCLNWSLGVMFNYSNYLNNLY